MNVSCVLLKRLTLNINLFPSFDGALYELLFIFSLFHDLNKKTVSQNHYDFIGTIGSVFRHQHFIGSKLHTKPITQSWRLGAKTVFFIWLRL